MTKLDLGHDGQRAVAAECLEVMPDRDANAILGPSHRRHIPLQRLQVASRVLAKDRRQQIFLTVEVKIDGPVRDSGRLGNLRHLRVEVAALGEHIDRRPQDAVPFAD